MGPKQTPIYDVHKEQGAKIVDFHGWLMPVQYTSIVQEHHAVRTNVGLFDVSHMGEFLVQGVDAEAFIQYLVTNNVARLSDNQAQYTLMVDENGGTIDDLLVYRLSAERYMLVVNAGNIDEDFRWVTTHRGQFNVDLRNISDEVGLIALQGPKASGILSELSSTPLDALKPFTFVVGEINGKKALISRTGYTGEDGFELYVKAQDAATIFSSLQSAGAEPCGLGARDTLRLEARLALYGNELSREVSPYEAGLGMFVKLDKGDFIGKSVLEAQKANGVTRKLVGIQTEGRAIPRSGYSLFADGKEIGKVTSGTVSPTLGYPLGLALIDIEYTQVDTPVEVEIRGRKHGARVVPTPFYKRNKK